MDLLELFRSRGALLEGHFGLTSGNHSTRYLQCALLLQFPDLARRVGEELADAARRAVGEVDVVLSPAVGGIVIGQETACALGARAIFAERVDGRMALRRGFSLAPGERVLAVEDVVTTGGSIREVVELAEAAGARVLGTASLVHRYQGLAPQPPTGMTHVSLLPIHAPLFPLRTCPLCARDIPLEKPGSRFLKK
jgi:orotate phosphoribosyltransferase